MAMLTESKGRRPAGASRSGRSPLYQLFIKRNLLKGLLFTSPWLLGLLAFYLYPICASLYYSLTSYSVFTAPEWVGLTNYTSLAVKDEVFKLAVYNSFVYSVMMIPSSIVFGLSMAFLLNTRIRGVSFYRALYFLPVLVPSVASAVLWQWVLNPRVGVINSILASMGIRGPGWLTSPTWSKPSLVLIGLWGAGQAVVIYLAALQDVPAELLDAAEVDGANGMEKIWHISIPMISPAIFFNLIMGMIGAFQVFTLPFVMTGGDGKPAQSLLFYALYLYRNAFLLLRMGRASAMAWMLTIVVLAATLFVHGTSARWVYYRGR
jgi:multiple sugar transport system permease protein